MGALQTEINNQHKSSQVKYWFLRRGETRAPGENPWCRAENQQTQTTYDTGSGNQTRGTLVGGECSHHCTIPASPVNIHYSSTRILQDTNDYFLSELTLSFCCSSKSPSTSLCNAFTCFSLFSTSSLRFLVSIVL